MELLYTNLLPLRTRPGNQTFLEAFAAALDEADQLDIATGYASKGGCYGE